MKKHIIVTRQPALIDFLIEKGVVRAHHECEVHEFATRELVKDRDVIGMLPHNLSVLCNTFTEIPLEIPKGKLGKELKLSDIRKYAREAVTYRIEPMLNLTPIECLDRLIDQQVDAMISLHRLADWMDTQLMGFKLNDLNRLRITDNLQLTIEERLKERGFTEVVYHPTSKMFVGRANIHTLALTPEQCAKLA